MKIVIGCDNNAAVLKELQDMRVEFRQALKLIGEQIMKTESEIKAAVDAAAAKVVTDLSDAITKEKQEVIEAIKKNPPAGISDAGLADLLSKVGSIGSSVLGSLDDISNVDSGGGTPGGPEA